MNQLYVSINRLKGMYDIIVNPLYISFNCIKGLYDIIMNPVYVSLNTSLKGSMI